MPEQASILGQEIGGKLKEGPIQAPPIGRDLATPNPMNQTDFAVPSDALSIDGTPPEEGDTVTFTVDGTVSRSEDGTIFVTPTMINGQEVSAPVDEEEEFNNMLQKADESEMENY